MHQQLVWPRNPAADLTVKMSCMPVETLSELFYWRANAIRPPRPILLDMFCGAGGASMGYYRAGFDVVGIDNVPQPNYPFPMIVTDAPSWINVNWWMIAPRTETLGSYDGFNAVHASPPCQRWSAMSNCRPEIREQYPDLIAPTRDLLSEIARVPWVIENVPGAPLIDPITLCGHMFGYELYRHRLFEIGGGVGARGFASWQLPEPGHPAHIKPGSRAGHWEPGSIISVSGHCAPMWLARKEMGGVDWMNRNELAESIPWYYTRYIGRQMLEHLESRLRSRSLHYA